MGKKPEKGQLRRKPKIQSRGASGLGKKERIWHELEMADPEMTSSMALESLHRFIRENHVVDLGSFQERSAEILKICKICDKWGPSQHIMTCEICEDNYHKNCYKGPPSPAKSQFICQQCLEAQIPQPTCKACLGILDSDTKVVTCSYCYNDYHKGCTRGKSAICIRCEKLRKTSIADAPRHTIKKTPKWQIRIKETNRNIRDMFNALNTKQQSIISEQSLLNPRKGCLFHALPSLEDHPKRAERYRESLMKAILEKGMEYTEDLRDIEFQLDCMKEGSMNFGLENMSPQEEREYMKYKKHPIGPFLLKNTIDKGYDVVTDADLPKNSIICEYVGEVVTLRECHELDLAGKNDSEMDLWVGRNADEKLIIRPERWTNIARFLNGVKNSSSAYNVVSMRLCYRGMPLVLLVSSRDIRKGESLCYDYNAGGIPAKYDTSGFVE